MRTEVNKIQGVSYIVILLLPDVQFPIFGLLTRRHY